MKNPMNTTRTLLLGLIASGAIVGAAFADGPQGHKAHRGPGPHGAGMMMQPDEATIEVAKATAEQMRAVREGAFESVRAAATQGVDTVKALGEKGVPTEAITLAAQQARDSILTAIIDADAQIGAIASSKVAELRAQGASAQQIMAVLRVRDRSLQALHQGAMRGQHAVGRAVRIATGEVDAPERPERPGQRPEGRRPAMDGAEGQRPGPGPGPGPRNGRGQGGRGPIQD